MSCSLITLTLCVCYMSLYIVFYLYNFHVTLEQSLLFIFIHGNFIVLQQWVESLVPLLHRSHTSTLGLIIGTCSAKRRHS
jgi:hypothetical protein